jgi:hypothetical protein
MSGLILVSLQSSPLSIALIILMLVVIVFPTAIGELGKHKRWVLYILLVISAIGTWFLSLGMLLVGVFQEHNGMGSIIGWLIMVAFALIFAIGLLIVAYVDFLKEYAPDGKDVSALKLGMSRAAIALACIAALLVAGGLIMQNAPSIYGGSTLAVVETILILYTQRYIERRLPA